MHARGRLALVLAAGCRAEPAESDALPSPTAPQDGVLVGQLHAHSSRSGDSQTPPEDVARWYAEHDFDFLVLTDHNAVAPAPVDPDILVIPGVELTLNVPHCDPPPEPGLACLLHVNALFVDPARLPQVPTEPPASIARRDLYAFALEQADALGGIAQLNHPNFHFAADAAMVEHLAARGLALMEVANEAIDSGNAGDATHPSTEAIWDAALLAGARVWGTATDDAHHYDDAQAVRARGEVAHTGARGFVAVRAARDPATIRAAIEAGRFWFSNGPRIAEIECTETQLRVRAEDPDADVAFVVDGREAPGTRAEGSLALAQARVYARAVVRTRQGTAWSQPCFAATRSRR
jgi:hypothetical protein